MDYVQIALLLGVAVVVLVCLWKSRTKPSTTEGYSVSVQEVVDDDPVPTPAAAPVLTPTLPQVTTTPTIDQGGSAEVPSEEVEEKLPNSYSTTRGKYRRAYDGDLQITDWRM